MRENKMPVNLSFKHQCSPVYCCGLGECGAGSVPSRIWCTSIHVEQLGLVQPWAKILQSYCLCRNCWHCCFVSLRQNTRRLLVLWLLLLFIFLLPTYRQCMWNTVDAEVKIPSSCWVPRFLWGSFKCGVDQNIALCALPAARNCVFWFVPPLFDH